MLQKTVKVERSEDRVQGTATRTQLVEGFQESGDQVEWSPGEKERVHSDGTVGDNYCPSHLFKSPISSIAFHVQVVWKEGRTAGQETSVFHLTLLGFIALSKLQSLWVLSVYFFQQRFTNTYLQCDVFSGGHYGRYKAVLNMALALKEPTDS